MFRVSGWLEFVFSFIRLCVLSSSGFSCVGLGAVLCCGLGVRACGCRSPLTHRSLDHVRESRVWGFGLGFRV